MEKGMVSVIIPVYGVENYLEKCVQSVVRQSYKNLEIILVDDGSQDACPRICDEWAEMDGRIRVIHQKNRGLSGARNAALDICKGEFLTFLDGDDMISFNMISKLLSAMNDNRADIVGCDFVKFEKTDQIETIETQLKLCQELNKVEVYSRDEILQTLVDAGGEWLVTACIKLYRAEVFEKIRFPEGKLHEDEFVIHQTLARASKYVYVKEPLYYYRQHNMSIMAQKKKWADNDEMESYEQRILFLHEKYAYIKLDKLIFKTIFLYMCLQENEKWKKMYREYGKQLAVKTRIKVLICRVNPYLYERIKGACK